MFPVTTFCLVILVSFQAAGTVFFLYKVTVRPNDEEW